LQPLAGEGGFVKSDAESTFREPSSSLVIMGLPLRASPSHDSKGRGLARDPGVWWTVTLESQLYQHFAHSTIPSLPSLSLPALAARCSRSCCSFAPIDLVLPLTSYSQTTIHLDQEGLFFVRTPHRHLTPQDTKETKEIVIQDGQPQDPEAVRMREGGGSCWKARGEARRGRWKAGWDGSTDRKGCWEGCTKEIEKRGVDGKTRRGEAKANEWT
jgi:hypothetical protein